MLWLPTTKRHGDEWDAERHWPHVPAVTAADVLAKVNVPGFCSLESNLGRSSQLTTGDLSIHKWISGLRGEDRPAFTSAVLSFWLHTSTGDQLWSNRLNEGSLQWQTGALKGKMIPQNGMQSTAQWQQLMSSGFVSILTWKDILCAVQQYAKKANILQYCIYA